MGTEDMKFTYDKIGLLFLLFSCGFGHTIILSWSCTNGEVKLVILVSAVEE